MTNKMKVRVNIYSVYSNEIIATIETASKNIKGAVYNFVGKNWDKLNICATETYYRLSN